MSHSPWAKIMLMLCIMCGAGLAGTVFVGNGCGSSPYATIQEGVDAAASGDTVAVCPGDYGENVVIGKPLTLRANDAEGNKPTIRARLPSRPALSITANGVNVSGFVLRDATGSFGLHLAASDADIRGMESTNNDIGFNIHSGSGNLLSGNNAHDNLDEGFRVASGSDNNFLSDNVACNQLYYGFYVFDGSGNRLVNNTACNSTGWYGFFLYSGARGNELANNTAYGNAYHGFHLYLNSDNSLIGNTARNNGGEGFRLSSSSDNSLAGNDAHGNAAEGFRLSSSSDNRLIGNAAYGNLKDGFLISSGSRNGLDGNSAYNNSLHGFYLHQSSDNRLASNNASMQEDGFHVFGGSRNRLEGNLASENGNGFYFDISSGDIVRSNIARDNLNHGFLFSSASKDTINSNEANSNGQNGFYCYLGSGNELSENSAHGNLDGFVLSSSSDNTASDNHAYGNLRNGFYLYQASGNHLEGNLAGNNSANGIYLYESPESSLEENIANDNGRTGIFLYLSSQCTLKGNVASGNGLDGIAVSSGTGGSLSGNIANKNAGRGLYLYLGSGNSLKGDEAHGNGVGCMVDTSRDADLKDLHLFNNTVDLIIGASTPYSLSISKAVFDDPSGKNRRFSTLSIEDTVEAGSAYNISWASQPAALPHPFISFEEKYVEISGSGPVSIDSISWHWAESEAKGRYNEDAFRIWKHDDEGWLIEAADLDVKNKKISLSKFTPGSTYGILQNRSIPSVALDEPENGAGINLSDIRLGWTAYSSDASAYCDITLNGSRQNPSEIQSPSGTATSYAVRLPREGAYLWNVTCRDSVGQNTSGTRAFSFDLPPSVRLASPGAERTNASPYSLGFTVQDNLSAALRCSLLVDGAASMANDSVPRSVPSSFIASLSEGNHSLQVNCTDASGNTGFSEVKNIVYDTGAPLVSLHLPPAGYMGNDSAVRFSYSAEDALSPQFGFSLYVDGALRYNGPDNHSSVPVAEGAHSWNVSARDGAGNTCYSEVRNFTIDRTAPLVAVISPAAGRTVVPGSIDILFNSSDADPSLSCSLIIDGSANRTNNSVSGTGTFRIINLSQGQHTVQISCTDDAGNAGFSGTKQVVFDSIAPIITLISPSEGYSGNDTKMGFVFNATDATETTCSLSIDGAQSSSVSNVPLAAGAHSWSVSCTDEANNSASSETRSLFLDQSPPSIIADSPANHARINSTSPAAVEFGFVATDDNSTPMRCSLIIDNSGRFTNDSVRSGARVVRNETVPLGNRHWRVECSDGAGNRGRTAEFTLSVGPDGADDDTGGDDGGEGGLPAIILSDRQLCPEGSTIISASSGAGTHIRLIDSQGVLAGSGNAVSGGEAAFTISEEGFYEARASKSGFRPATLLFYHIPCPRTDTGGGGGNQSPGGGSGEANGTSQAGQGGGSGTPAQNATEGSGGNADGSGNNASHPSGPVVFINVTDTAYPGDIVIVQVYVDGNPASVGLAVESPFAKSSLRTDASGSGKFRVQDLGRHTISVNETGLPEAKAYLDVRERSYDAEHYASPFRYSFCMPFIFPLALLLLALLLSAYFVSRVKARKERRKGGGNGKSGGERYDYKQRNGGGGLGLF